MTPAIPRSQTLGAGGIPSFWVEELGEIERREWDLLVCSIGYEERSRYFLERYSARSSAVLVSGYSTRRVQSYARNLDIAYQITSSISIESDDEFVARLPSRLNKALSEAEGQPRLLIDISSCSRVRLAALVKSALDRRCICDFVYAPGVFHLPPDDPVALAFTGPVLPSFMGAPAPSASSDLRAIIGLGYQALEALGALQLLEPSEIWALVPVDEHGEYERVVREENASLLDMLRADHVIRYAVCDGLATYSVLEQLVYGAGNGVRSVIVPLGPKIFALCGLLTSARFGRSIPVWRFSADQFGDPVDVKATEAVAGLTVHAKPVEYV